MTEERPTVEVAVLHMGTVATEIARTLLLMVKETRFNVVVGFSSANPTMANRCGIVRKFLEGGSVRAVGLDGKPDFLLMMDDDNPPKRNPLDLAVLNLDVVGFPTPMWKAVSSPRDPILFNFKPLGEGKIKRVGGVDLVEVESIGAGVLLIARRVLEHPAMRPPFLDEFDEWGERVMGGDITFCRRVRDAGFKVWAALSHNCKHLKTVDLTTVHELLLAAGQETGRDVRIIED